MSAKRGEVVVEVGWLAGSAKAGRQAGRTSSDRQLRVGEANAAGVEWG